MARTVEDCAYLLQALAGHDPTDPASSRAPVPDYVGAARAGRPRAPHRRAARLLLRGRRPRGRDGASRRRCATLRRLGADVRDVADPAASTVVGSFMVILLAEAFAYHERDLREHPELYGEVLRERLLAGALITGAEYVQAQRLRARLRREMATVLAPRRRAGHADERRSPRPTFAAGLRSRLRLPREQHGALQHDRAARAGAAVRLHGARACRSRCRSPAARSTRPRCCASGHAYEQATEWHKRHPAL